MASISDLIQQQVVSEVKGVEIPSNLTNKVVSGLSDSVLGSLTQTVAKSGGLETIKELLSGKANAASSPVTKLAGSLFSNNVLKSLNLGSTANSALTSLVPKVMTSLTSVIKDRDGDGDVDLNDILLSLKGGSSTTASVIGAAGSILGSLFGKK